MSQKNKRQIPDLKRGKVSSLISNDEKELYSVGDNNRAENNETQKDSPVKGKSAVTRENVVKHNTVNPNSRSGANSDTTGDGVAAAASESASSSKSNKSQVLVYFHEDTRMMYEQMLMAGAFVTLKEMKAKLQQTELVELMTRHYFTLFENDRAAFDRFVIEKVASRKQ